MSRRNPSPPPLAILTVLCWALVLWIQVPWAASFVVVTSSANTNRVGDSSPYRSQTTALQSAVDDAVSNNDAVGNGGFFWDFRGHSCYAEILPSSVAKKQKPTVLLIHGFACSTVYWRETKEYLTREGYTVHAVDLLGQGKSSKPGRTENIVYSIDLWAQMVDEYAANYLSSSEVVLVGNSLGSLVGLSATTGDCYANDEENGYLSSRVQGLCLFNCGVGLNTKNIIKTASSPLARTLFEALFVVLDFLIFGNKALLTYVIDKQVSKELLSEALTALYQYAEEGKVDDELVDSFLDPVRNDKTEAVVDVLSQIYTNDPGRTPMELHDRYSLPPIHLIWGDQDTVTPIAGDVGQFYTELAATPDSNVSLEMIPNAGHVLFDERPECNQGLIEWLERTF